MKSLLRRAALALCFLVLVGALAAVAWLSSKRVQRDGLVPIAGLQAAVTVRYDDRGVPHVKAEHELDLYRALGYVHAQDRLFQMEMLRRLARGELAEVLGPSVLPFDRLFRTLTIRDRADAQAAKLDPALPSTQALRAYLDGVNQFQDTRPLPVEFDLLRLPRRPFTEADTLSVAGYLAYSFAAALRTEPVLTRIRDQWGPAHLAPFGATEVPGAAAVAASGALPALAPTPAEAAAAAPPASGAASSASPDAVRPAEGGVLRTQGRPRLNRQDHAVLLAWAGLNTGVQDLVGLPAAEGSNAWAVAGTRTASGKPLLAGDPHITFALPAVWYEAHLSAPGIELYGHFQALTPFALLGVSPQAAWSLTMFQNDDIDLVAETTHPDHPGQVRYHDGWVALSERDSQIRVKGGETVTLRHRRSPHGPIINDALEAGSAGTAPIAMWWALLETENPLLEAFYRLNRATSLAQAREAAALIHAPGLNVVWANAAGDIAWWAAARLPQRPPGVRADLVLDGSTPAADKLGFLPFSANPQEENPARGYIVSANHAPTDAANGAPPGYYNPPDRARRLEARLREGGRQWTSAQTQSLQLDTGSDALALLTRTLVARLQARATAPDSAAWLMRLAAWDGRHPVEAVEPTLAAQWLYEAAKAIFADELGPEAFAQLLRTRALDEAVVRVVAQPDSPWWDRVDTPGKEGRDEILLQAWQATWAHLRTTFGPDPQTWTWGRAHTLTHAHPFAKQPPFDRLFNVGPFPVAGGRETPNNMAFLIGPAPWKVSYGPSTRRIVDFAAPGRALGINPLGQSGVWLDAHRSDQAADYLAGRYRAQPLLEADVSAATRSQLQLRPR